MQVGLEIYDLFDILNEQHDHFLMDKLSAKGSRFSTMSAYYERMIVLVRVWTKGQDKTFRLPQ